MHSQCMIHFYHYVPSVLQYDICVPIYVLCASVIYYAQGVCLLFLGVQCMPYGM